MQEELLQEVFEKALGDGASETAFGIATHIHEELEEIVKPQTATSVDAIRGYFRRHQNGESSNLTRNTRNQLAKYLGQPDYKGWLKSKKKRSVNSRRYVYAVIMLAAGVLYLGYDKTLKKCMIWEEDRYVKIHCEEADATTLDPRLLRDFRKVAPECDVGFFFNEDGSPRVFYYKRGPKDLELFTMLAEHPVHGVALKKITPYMIREHLCEGMY